MATALRELDAVAFEGHPNVRATHRNTMEVTKDERLTLRGDCIIGVRGDKAAADLSEEAKTYIRAGGGLVMELQVSGIAYRFTARGSPELQLTDLGSMVIRRSSFVSPRTIALGSSAAARDIPRPIVTALRRGARGRLVIYGLP